MYIWLHHWSKSYFRKSFGNECLGIRKLLQINARLSFSNSWRMTYTKCKPESDIMNSSFVRMYFTRSNLNHWNFRHSNISSEHCLQEFFTSSSNFEYSKSTFLLANPEFTYLRKLTHETRQTHASDWCKQKQMYKQVKRQTTKTIDWISTVWNYSEGKPLDSCYVPSLDKFLRQRSDQTFWCTLQSFAQTWEAPKNPDRHVPWIYEHFC